MPIDDNKNSKPPNKDKVRPWYGVGSELKLAKIKKDRYIRGKITLALVVAVLVGTALFNPGTQSKNLDGGVIQHPATFAAIVAGCDGIVSYPPADPKEIGWVALQHNVAVFNWRTLPPVFGNFNQNAWTKPGYIDSTAKPQPQLSQSVADLYRGWVYIWYAKSPTTKTSLDGLSQWAHSQALPGKPFVAAQWGLSGTQYWPQGRNIMLAAWGKKEYCVSFDSTAVEEFRKSAAQSSAPGVNVPITAAGPKAQVRTIDLPQ